MKEKKDQIPLTNEEILAKKVQLVTHEGVNLGVVSREEALGMARKVELDLVMLAEHGKEGVPVVKIMDFGKVLYEKKKKKSEAKKHQKVIQIKEIKMRPSIGVHDFQTKIKQMAQFLKEGKRVKVTLVFKGREITSKEERGAVFFQKIDSTLTEDHSLANVMYEKDTKLGQFWSRIYYLKS